jgi:hypothetical protein
MEPDGAPPSPLSERAHTESEVVPVEETDALLASPSSGKAGPTVVAVAAPTPDVPAAPLPRPCKCPTSPAARGALVVLLVCVVAATAAFALAGRAAAEVPPRVLIFHVDNRPLLNEDGSGPSGLFGVAAAVNAQYAAARGHDFMVLRPVTREQPNATDCPIIDVKHSCTCHNTHLNVWRSVPWCKVPAFWLAAGWVRQYTHVIFLDSDNTMRNVSVTIDRHQQLLHNANATIIFTSDLPWSQAPCSGYYMSRTGDAARVYTKRWWNTWYPRTDQSHAYEQNALYEFMDKQPVCRDKTLVLRDEWQFRVMEPDQLLYHEVFKNETMLRFVLRDNGWPADDASIAAVLRGVHVHEFDTAQVEADMQAFNAAGRDCDYEGPVDG